MTSQLHKLPKDILITLIETIENKTKALLFAELENAGVIQVHKCGVLSCTASAYFNTHEGCCYLPNKCELMEKCESCLNEWYCDQHMSWCVYCCLSFCYSHLVPIGDNEHFCQQCFQKHRE